VSIFFGNITNWSLKAKEFLFGSKDICPSCPYQFDVILTAETHLRGEAMSRARRQVLKLGWQSTGCPSIPTGQGGCHGGLLLCMPTHRRRFPVLGKGEATASHQWVAEGLRTHGHNLVIYGLYGQHGVGAQGINAVQFQQIAEHISSLRGPWVIAGDFNYTPDELRASMAAS
jgi:endonuclease/exonuclease/phosphatase (EEP) superfamily protein YafD